MQQSNRFFSALRRAYMRYDRLMEKQGFYIVLCICVLTILGSALYTFHFRQLYAQPQPVQPAVQAGGTQQMQTLAQAQELIASEGAQPITVPTEAPFRFVQPVAGFLDRDYSLREPQFFPAAHYWRAHPGIDLQADYGAVVQASADGRVLSVQQDNELGLCITIQHDHDYQTVYAGLSSAAYVRAGDPVKQGQTIGHVGNGVLAEADAQPHLHFEVWRGGSSVDPVEMFLGVNPS